MRKKLVEVLTTRCAKENILLMNWVVSLGFLVQLIRSQIN